MDEARGSRDVDSAGVYEISVEAFEARSPRSPASRARSREAATPRAKEGPIRRLLRRLLRRHAVLGLPGALPDSSLRE